MSLANDETKRAIVCPQCGCADFEKRGTRRTYHPLTADLEADSWNEGDIEIDMFDSGEDEIVYCCGCDSEFTESELRTPSRQRGSLTNEEIDRRIEAWQEGDSNDQEIDGLTDIIRELQAEREAPPPNPKDEWAREKARVMWASDDLEVDRDARVNHLDEPGTGVEGAAWVQAWVFVPADEAA